MDDWDAAQEQRPKPALFPNRGQIRLIVLGAVVLLVVNVVLQLGVKHHRTPEAENDAAAQQAVSLLFGGDDTLRANDPGALNLPPGQSVVLQSREIQVRVTPEHVSVGTGNCVAGPLVTVDLSVEQLQNFAELTPEDFSMRTADGKTVPAIPACSTGFDDEAPKRTLVFEATQPGQLIYGTAPEAVWRLT
jgi:hypothetical protein